MKNAQNIADLRAKKTRHFFMDHLWWPQNVGFASRHIPHLGLT